MSLVFHTLHQVNTHNQTEFKDFRISYEVFGQKLHTAPLIVVIHALTGNSDLISPEKGWWKTLIGYGKTIDLDKYTVLAFNIPGNGYDGFLIEEYQNFKPKDIAKIFNQTIGDLNITEVYAVIGGSLGGGISWEMNVLKPKLFKYLIPVASDWKSTDWVIAQCKLQEDALLNSDIGIQQARKIAMMFYRTPSSLKKRFGRTKRDDGVFNVVSWLNHHGKKLEDRFEKQAYLLMNHLLSTIDITGNNSFKETVKELESEVIQVAVKGDLLFIPEENIATQSILNQLGIRNQYHEIQSIHGHDAFLIEFEQLSKVLEPIFNN